MSASFSTTLKDCKVDYFSGTGPGGQHRNKHQNCVRLYHEPSGVRVVAQSHREKRANEGDAMTKLSQHPKFRFWASERIKEMEGRESIAEAVDRMLREETVCTDLNGQPL